MRRIPAGFGLRFALAAGIVASCIGAPARAADITVFCTQALRTMLIALAPRFEAASGHRLILVVAPSGQLVRRLRAGEIADLLIANASNIDALIAEGRIAGNRIDLARSQVGLAVRAGAPKPDIATPEALRRALLNAKAVAYVAGGLSGNAFESVLAELGIAEVVKAKAKLGSPAAGFVARGEADIAVQQIPELIAVDGAELVGPLPPELARVTQFSMGAVAGTKEPAAVAAVMRFLSSNEAAATIRAKGLTPGQVKTFTIPFP